MLPSGHRLECDPCGTLFAAHIEKETGIYLTVSVNFIITGPRGAVVSPHC
jgi:hypothetical protein